MDPAWLQDQSAQSGQRQQSGGAPSRSPPLPKGSSSYYFDIQPMNPSPWSSNPWSPPPPPSRGEHGHRSGKSKGSQSKKPTTKSPWTPAEEQRFKTFERYDPLDVTLPTRTKTGANLDIEGVSDVEPSCAICGAPPVPECLHERERLELALNQATWRWSGFTKIRKWVLDRARDSVLSTFEELKTARYRAHIAYLQTVPCFTLYQKYLGKPPLSLPQLQTLEGQIHHAREIYKAGVDEDWRRSCLTYPDVLDYFFELVDFDLPDHQDNVVPEPVSMTQDFGFGEEVEKYKPTSRDTGDVFQEPLSTIESPSFEGTPKGRATDDFREAVPMPLLQSSEAALNVQPDIDDLGPLLDPRAYFQSVDNLESRIIETCRLGEVFGTDPSRNEQKSAPSTNKRSARVKRMVPDLRSEDLADRVLLAMQILRDEGLFNGTMTILVQDPNQRGVVCAKDIDIGQISKILHNMQHPGALLSGSTRRMASNTLIHPLSLEVDHQMPAEKLGGTFCRLLLLALLSYGGSHCSFPAERVWGNGIDSFSFEGLTMNGQELAFRKQDLHCLGDFIGGPVWIFGQPAPSKPAMLSTSIVQFTSLWGPTFAIPLKESFDTLVALKVDGGVIHRVNSDSSKQETSGQNTPEVLMHFTPTGSFNKEVSRDGRGCSDSFVYDPTTDERLPDRMLPFAATARLLIGQPNSSMTQTAESATEEHHGDIDGCMSTFLQINPRCGLDLREFLKKNHHRMRPLGTRDAVYVPDQLQASFGAGQYVNAGIAKVWRRRPATRYKEILVEYCSRPRANIDQILSLNLGLELSICTGNAQRLSLWDTLLLSHPDIADELRDARASGDSMMLAAYISRLGKTGLDERGSLSLYWPFKTGYPDVVELSTALPIWCNVLSESMTSACFATMSERCLSYYGQDRLRKPRQRIRRACHGQTERYSQSILQTAVNFHPDSQPSLPLHKGTQFLLGNGILQMRNVALAFYRMDSVMQRMTRALEHGSTPVHHELLDPQRAGSIVLRTCIMDEF